MRAAGLDGGPTVTGHQWEQNKDFLLLKQQVVVKILSHGFKVPNLSAKDILVDMVHLSAVWDKL